MPTHWSVQALRDAISRLPRFPLTHLPTPIDDCCNLSKALGGKVRILMKRDDLTTSGLGGNKVRRLEFIMGRALAEGCDCIVHGLAAQSNYCRQTAAAAARAGLECYLILRQDAKCEDPPMANRLMDYVFGAKVEMVPAGGVQTAAIDALVERLKSEGRKPYRIGPADEILGTISYALSMAEILEQTKAMGITPIALAVTAREGTLAGLVLGKCLLGFEGRVQAYDMDPRSTLPRWRQSTCQLVQDTAAVLGASVELSADDIHISGEFSGPAYAEPSAACLDALLLLGRTEGLVAGPVYVAKGLAGFFDDVRKGQFPSGGNVVFVHTGGTPEAFAYNAEIFAHLNAVSR
jgi:1-aminocyclopropane-1-carboxylate deaminase/D-cysteine desulfhydrase-like pyridoxal-dependent ACC family enzyme